MIVINYNKIKIEGNEDVVIHFLGDFHIGHKNCDLNGIKEKLASIPKTEHNRIILMGDLMESSTKSSIGAGVYEQKLIPDEQIDMLCDLFEEHKEQIDGAVLGNHEYRIFKDSGVDIMKQFCKRLNIPYMLYSGVVTYSIKSSEGKRAYNVNFFHGKSGGGVENALRACKAMSNKVVADIYAMGHCHHNAFTKRQVKYIDSRNEKIVEGTQYFVLTGHMLEYDDGYADMQNLEISTPGFPCAVLSYKNKEIKII